MRARRVIRQALTRQAPAPERQPIARPAAPGGVRLRQLQRTGGNRAVARLFERAALHTLSARGDRTAARRQEPHTAGLPDVLRSGVERISGVPMGGVQVHYNSARPAEHQAHAFAQGRDIHVAPGQERYLPHEAWHVVQQAHGRVRPTTSTQAGALANTDPGLEREADVMGRQALRGHGVTQESTGRALEGAGHGAAVMQTAPKQEEKRPKDLKNDTWEGDKTGPLADPGTTFTEDPFDHTVVVVRADGTGVQYTYVAVDEDKPGGPRMKLYHTEQLSAIRVKAIAFLDKHQGTFQESETGPADRKKKDAEKHADNVKKWLEKDPANEAPYNAYLEALKKYNGDMDAFKSRVNKEKGEKPPTPPPPPKGMPAVPRTTLCNGFPPDMGEEIASDRGALGNFDPEVEGTKRHSWRTLDTQPDGPKPGDVYSLGAAHDKKTIKHLGVFKSSRPGPNDLKIWTVVDGGQGKYESRQEVWERTRFFNPKTQLLSTKLADAGQSDDDRSLRGWIDIEEHFKKQGSA